MDSRVFISVSLVLIILLAGCVSGGKTKTEIISKDMVVINGIDIYPSKEVQPDDTIIIRMDVANEGQNTSYLLVDKDATRSSDAAKWNGDYLLIDHCSSLYREPDRINDAEFRILSGQLCEADYAKIPLVKDSIGNEIRDGSCYLKVSPQQALTFQWTLKAPSSGDVAEMTQKCTFKFQIAYAAKAVTNAYVYFADPVELAQRLYTKNELSLVGDNIASFGPVAINFVPAEPQPIPAKSPGKWTVFLNLMNLGTGLTDVTTLSIILPAGSGITTYKVGVDDKCLMGGALDVKILKEKQRVLEILNRVVPYPPQFQVRSKLQTYLQGSDPGCSGKSTGDCSPENQALIQKYNVECNPLTSDAFCNSLLSEVTANVNDAMDRLQIIAGKSSRIPCELTTPTVPILTPFRFSTMADYNYKIRKDIDVTTKPARLA